MRRAIAFILMLAAQASLAAEPFGRLFFTPAQRAQLDIARADRNRAAPAPERNQVAVPVPETLTYGGVVRRSGGGTTLWINDRAIDGGNPGQRLPVTGGVRADGSIDVTAPDTKRSVNLRVGQSVDVNAGWIGEPYVRRPEVSTRPATGAARGPENTRLLPSGTAVRDQDDSEDRR